MLQAFSLIQVLGLKTMVAIFIKTKIHLFIIMKSIKDFLKYF